jgi:hypothetical protein
VALLVASLAFPGVVTLAGDAHPASRLPSGPTLAVEDTIHALVAEPLPEVVITAPRQTLDDILRHVAEGEAYRDSMIVDQAFTLFIRMAGRDSKKDGLEKSEPYLELATRIYQKQPDKQRTVVLREWSRYDKKDEQEETEGGEIDIHVGDAGGEKTGGKAPGDKGSPGEGHAENTGNSDKEDRKTGVSVSVNSGMGEQFVAFAFDPKTRSRFRFRIEDRKIIGDQVIYVIAFSPKSPLDVLPTGRAWVNTNDFVILREEFAYRDRSPAPLFMESLDSCILERTRIDGQYWVLSRILARVTLTDPVRLMGKIARTKVPKVADFAVTWNDWIINGGIPDSLFAPAATKEAK